MIAYQAGQTTMPSALPGHSSSGHGSLASLAWNHMGEAHCQLDS